MLELGERILQAPVCNHSAESMGMFDSDKFQTYEEQVLLYAEKVAYGRANILMIRISQ